VKLAAQPTIQTPRSQKAAADDPAAARAPCCRPNRARNQRHGAACHLLPDDGNQSPLPASNVGYAAKLCVQAIEAALLPIVRPAAGLELAEPFQRRLGATPMRWCSTSRLTWELARR